MNRKNRNVAPLSIIKFYKALLILAGWLSFFTLVKMTFRQDQYRANIIPSSVALIHRPNDNEKRDTFK